MLIDIHTHLMNRKYQEHKRQLLQMMEQYSIDRIYVSAIAGHANPDEKLVAEGNREVSQFVRENPGRVEGYVYVSPEHSNARDVVKRGVEEQGLCAVKLWMSTTADDPRVNPTIEQCIHYNIPVLIHAFSKVVGQLPNETLGTHVANIARRYPEARFIMAHLGGNAYHGLPAIRKLQNVWVDASGSIFRGDSMMYAYEMLGADRILFGTDLPGTYLPSYGQILEMDIEESERQKILYQNAITVFGYGAAEKAGRASSC